MARTATGVAAPAGAGRASVPAWLAAATILPVALLLGWMVSVSPEWLSIDLVFTRPEHVLVVFAVCGLALAVLKWPEAATYGLIAVVYTNASEIGVRFHGLPSILQALLPMLLVAIVGRALLSREDTLVVDPVLAWMGLHVLVVLGCSASVLSTELADDRLVELGKQACLVIVVIHLLRTPKALEGAARTLVVVGAFLGTITTVQVLTSTYDFPYGGFGRIKDAQIVEDIRDARVTGPLSDPNFYAQVLVVLVPVAFYRIWDERTRWGKVLAGYALLVVLAALAFTYSRGGMVALVGIGALVAIRERRRLVRYAPIVAVLLVLGVVVAPENLVGRLETLQQLLPGAESELVRSDSSLRQRVLYMRTAAEIFLEHPVRGVGAGNFAAHYDDYAERLGSSVSSYEHFDKQRYPHSLYLELAAESGLLGLGAFLALVLAVFSSLHATARRFEEAGEAAMSRLMVALALGLLGFLVTSVFLHGTYMRHFWIVVALAVAGSAVSRRVAAADPARA